MFEFNSFNWKDRLEELFPEVPSESKKYNLFLEYVYKNIVNFRYKRLGDKYCELSWFYQVMKLANKKFRKENIIIIWLWLCIKRPWRENKFLFDWGENNIKEFYKVIDILEKIEEKYNIRFRCTSEISGDRTFRRYKKNELVRALIPGLFTQDYNEFVSSWDDLRLYKKFITLLKSETLVTKREYQRKLRINSKQLNELIEEAKKKKIIKVMNLSKNSVALFYNPPK